MCYMWYSSTYLMSSPRSVDTTIEVGSGHSMRVTKLYREGIAWMGAHGRRVSHTRIMESCWAVTKNSCKGRVALPVVASNRSWGCHGSSAQERSVTAKNDEGRRPSTPEPPLRARNRWSGMAAAEDAAEKEEEEEEEEEEDEDDDLCRSNFQMKADPSDPPVRMRVGSYGFQREHVIATPRTAATNAGFI